MNFDCNNDPKTLFLVDGSTGIMSLALKQVVKNQYKKFQGNLSPKPRGGQPPLKCPYYRYYDKMGYRAMTWRFLQSIVTIAWTQPLSISCRTHAGHRQMLSWHDGFNIHFNGRRVEDEKLQQLEHLLLNRHLILGSSHLAADKLKMKFFLISITTYLRKFFIDGGKTWNNVS